jgi:MoxR-like ATPase
MKSLYPLAPSKEQPSPPKELPVFSASELRKSDNYLPDAGLVDAINVALMLRQPLIVTGDPGTGKTVLAWSIAWELGLSLPLVFETKSTSQSKDLFYFYDTLGRFTAKELRADAGDPKDCITYNALGAAIILSNDPEIIADVLPKGLNHPGKQRSVVLIDEVEKAPRDFPNDILSEIERMYFRIPELGNRRIEADESWAPVVVMTNNAEKSLPDAFLRRCIYYHIEFPLGDRLEKIVMARLPEFARGNIRSVLVSEVIDFALSVRKEEAGLDKRPGTAELLNWLSAILKLGGAVDRPLTEQIDLAERALPSFAKISGDQTRVRALLGSWKDGRSRR